jgi:SagB-type dehydrogenase family enzyme
VADREILLGLACSLLGCREPTARLDPEHLAPAAGSAPAAQIALPPPATSGARSFEEVLASRRSVRSFDPRPLPIGVLGQLAWAAQGVTDRAEGLRTAPSAGALYPLEVYFVTATGTLHYLPEAHRFEPKSHRDLRPALATAALSQEALKLAPCDVVITSVTDRTRKKYHDRSVRYVAIEAGHVGQNLLLQATASGLHGVPIGAFDDRAVRDLLALADGEDPVYLLALGYPAAP